MELAPCDAVLSSLSAWKLSGPASGDCACCSPRKSSKHLLSDDESDAETHSVGSRSGDDDDTMSSSSSLAADDETLAVTIHEDAPSMEAQSPIDIRTNKADVVPMSECGDAVVVSSHVSDAELVYDGKGFKVHLCPTTKNSLMIGEKVYHAVQFHFHTPSEHTLDGQHLAMEMHLVHQADDGALAIVAVCFHPGKENAFLAQFWSELDELEVGERACVALSGVDLRALEIPSAGFYRYCGSLTTPPFTEGVQWVVVQQIAEASGEQLKAFRRVLPGPNARGVQPLNKREVRVVV